MYLYLARVFIELGAPAGPGRQPDPGERRDTDYPQQLSRPLETLTSTLQENGQPAGASAAAATSAPIGFRRYDVPTAAEPPADGRLDRSLPVADTGGISSAETEAILDRYLSLPQNQPGAAGFSFAELQGFLRKYARVVQCIEAGLSNRQTAREWGGGGDGV